MRKPIIILLLAVGGMAAQAQPTDTGNSSAADHWVDSVFKTLSPDEKITQLMVIRMSAIDPATRGPLFFDSLVDAAVRRYNVGGICLFQGGPLAQASRVNYFLCFFFLLFFFCIDAVFVLGL